MNWSEVSFFAKTFVLILISGIFISCSSCANSTCGVHLSTCDPVCRYVPEPERVRPIDPFEANNDNDGLTAEQRMSHIRKCVASTVQISVRRYSKKTGYTFFGGSGVFIDNNHVLTAEHVIRDSVSTTASLRRVLSKDGRVGVIRVEKVNLISANDDYDVALLKVDAPNNLVRPIKIAESPIYTKNDILWNFGARTSWSRGRVIKRISALSPGVTKGLVQMKMLGQKGDSGGAVTNSKGELVGIHLRGNDRGDISYFIPIEIALESVGYTQP